MATKQLIDFVNKLKESGINVSFSKPRSQLLLTLHQHTTAPSLTIRPFTKKKQALN